MRLTQLLTTCALAFALGGCLSGQTGSPDCVGPESCICDPLYASGPLLRVHGESSDMNGHLIAVVDQVFPLTSHATDIQVGDRIGGSIIAEKPCGAAYHAETFVGADLFVMYFDGGGDRLDGAFSWVIPWGDTLDFGNQAHELPTSDMAVLDTVDTCLAKFPADPAPPCNDTIEAGACTVSPAAPENSADKHWTGVLALLGVVLLRLRAQWRPGPQAQRPLRSH